MIYSISGFDTRIGYVSYPILILYLCVIGAVVSSVIEFYLHHLQISNLTLEMFIPWHEGVLEIPY